MAFKFTIGRKIGAGFGVVILSTIIAFFLTNKTLNESKHQTDEVVGVVTPSVMTLEEFSFLLEKSQNLITKWYHIQSREDDIFKKELKLLINAEFPKLKTRLDSLSKNWQEKDKKELLSIEELSKSLFDHYDREIMSQLNSWSSYEDAQLMFLVRLPFEEIDDKLKTIFEKLDALIASQKTYADEVTDKMYTSFTFLQEFVRWLGIALAVGGLLTAIFTVRSIVRPVRTLKRMLQSMSLGVIPKERLPKRGDEIGEMGNALEGLVQSLESTTEFARQVGSGNFQSEFAPLSEHDTLGHALLKMRHDLHENERVLEQKVIERTEEVVRQKEEIQVKNEQLEILYKHVTDSIRYAKRLQDAILPPDHLVKQYLPKSFIYFKPKDIVSGDFYWIDKKDGKVLFAAVDCTGHGVPGAFMSMVGHNALKDIVKNTNIIKPSEILDRMSEAVNKALHNENEEANGSAQTKDGMDMSLCSIDYENMKLEFAGAFNPLYIIRKGELKQIKANKFPIGFRGEEDPEKFTNHTIDLQKGDTIYIFSDGYADQFGGPKGKKFMAGNFRELLRKVANEERMENQHAIIHKTIEDWRGELEQVDDIVLIGVKV